jgi:hypothetical protein
MVFKISIKILIKINKIIIIIKIKWGERRDGPSWRSV